MLPTRRFLPLILGLLMLLATLPAAAQSGPCAGELDEKSRLGLMPPACGPAPGVRLPTFAAGSALFGPVADVNGDGGQDIALASRTPGLTVLSNLQSAPIASITSPVPYSTVVSGDLPVSGMVSAAATRVQVRAKGLTDWIEATLTGTSWTATLKLPNIMRPLWIEARAIDATGRVHDLSARVRVRASGRVQEGLLVEYQFDERSGTVVHDSSEVGVPLDLNLADEAAVSRVPDGIFAHTPTRIASPAAADKVIQALKESQAFTLEAWIRTANLRQDGPARIMTLSDDSKHLNVSLIQDRSSRGARVGVRVQTSDVPAGDDWYESMAELPITTDLTHVLVTRTISGTLMFYINGVAQGHSQTTGDFSTWNDSYKLLLANDNAADRPWLGEYHLAAIYRRALTAEEVNQNYAAGPIGDGSPAQLTDAQLVYTFNEGSGTVIGDSSLVLPALPASITEPRKVSWAGDSLTIMEPTIIATESAATKVIRAMMATGELSIEAWVTPTNTTQSGPAQIMNIGKSTWQSNLALAQGQWGHHRADRYAVRIRSSGYDNDDVPYLRSSPGSLTPRLTHVVYTRDAGGRARLFINGVEQADADGKGDFSKRKGPHSLHVTSASCSMAIDMPMQNASSSWRVSIWGKRRR